MSDRYQIRVLKAIPDTSTRYEIVLRENFETDLTTEQIVNRVKDITAEAER